jgi:hypothetical protein
MKIKNEPLERGTKTNIFITKIECNRWSILTIMVKTEPYIV